MRLFIAIELSRSSLQILEGVCETFRRSTSGIRWVDRKKLHLTLAFLDEQPGNRLDGIRSCMERAAARVEPFTMTVDGFGAFPNLRRPRIIWAGVDETEPLSTLHYELQKALKEAGLPAESRKFRPHITLGRVRSGKKKDQQLRDLMEHFRFQPLENRITELVLFESKLKKSGAEYAPVLEVPL